MKSMDTESVKKKFRKIQNIRLITTAIAVIIAPFIYITKPRHGIGSSSPIVELPSYISITIAVIALLLLLISLILWRCPVCNKFLGRSTIITKCCKCGTKFI